MYLFMELACRVYVQFSFHFMNVSKRWEWPIQSDTQILTSFLQFRRVANLYFLMISILSSTPIRFIVIPWFHLYSFLFSVLMWKNVVCILGNFLSLAHASFRFDMQFKRDKSPKMKTGVWDKLDVEHEYLLNSWKMEIWS